MISEHIWLLPPPWTITLFWSISCLKLKFAAVNCHLRNDVDSNLPFKLFLRQLCHNKTRNIDINHAQIYFREAWKLHLVCLLLFVVLQNFFLQLHSLTMMISFTCWQINFLYLIASLDVKRSLCFENKKDY